ncbi:Phosphatidate cytidylyltransferase protein [Dioscorea alata]|uniref:Phosphatidate cytidylyltransferase protein n=1 Tax=Dioscorea alata TaxID=55571 RepID=A0ACB7W8S2_DIOAL|nr:Phosphatidate cytidylyltransferase protein [Dioscorea alata]
MALTAAAQLAAPLELFPPLDFCCAYGSSLLPTNNDKTSMVDYILGVQDPLQWHQDNLERNRDHYSNCMARLGPKTITRISNGIGVGVYFNPFVEWRGKKIKYGVVSMQDLAWDVLTWEKFYLSGRLQKPVHFLVDNWEISKVNLVNLKAATSAALLFLPDEFTEEDLYGKICSLSYMGDLRMLFAEDKNKVKKIVQGSFNSFRAMYKPFLEEYASEGLLKVSSFAHQKVFKQDTGLSATSHLFTSLPSTVLKQAAPKLGLNKLIDDSGVVSPNIVIHSRDKVKNSVHKVLRRIVMISSARQAVSGLVAAGGVNAAVYLARKISKSWRSRTT